jgi:holo-[acyl-carrier-protein] synthase
LIKGIGNDIIEINRIKKAIERPRFMEKHYTSNEIALYQSRNNNIEILAGNFAVKESVSKVFGTGVRGFSLKDIEVLRDELGKPYILLHNEAKKFAEEAQIEQILVSIAHSEKYVVGFAIGEGV